MSDILQKQIRSRHIKASRVKTLPEQPRHSEQPDKNRNYLIACKKITLRLSEGWCPKVEVIRICKLHNVGFMGMAEALGIGESEDSKYVFFAADEREPEEEVKEKLKKRRLKK